MIHSQIDSCQLEEIFVNPERMPIWKNGTNEEFVKDVYSKLKYPNEFCGGGMMILQFTISKEGKVKNPKIRRSIYHKFDEQLLEIIKDYEFIPGTMHGIPVEVQMNLPIRIRLE